MRITVYCLASLLAAAMVQAGSGQQAAEEQITPRVRIRQIAEPAAPPTDSITSLMDTRPPIDEFSSPYLLPHKHPDLPAHIADWLDEQRYVIPQYIPDENLEEYFPINAITGEFIKKGQTDWAVYCTGIERLAKRKNTAIIIFKNGKVESPEIVDYFPKLIDYEFSDSVQFGCCYEYITTVSPDSIYATYLGMKKYGVPAPPPLDHDGILGSVFMETPSVFYYRYEGKWIAIRASI